jgi:hypothetical protein
MMTLTASPRTIKTPAPITLSRRSETARTNSPAPRGFWLTLLRALSAASA